MFAGPVFVGLGRAVVLCCCRALGLWWLACDALRFLGLGGAVILGSLVYISARLSVHAWSCVSHELVRSMALRFAVAPLFTVCLLAGCAVGQSAPFDRRELAALTKFRQQHRMTMSMGSLCVASSFVLVLAGEPWRDTCVLPPSCRTGKCTQAARRQRTLLASLGGFGVTLKPRLGDALRGAAFQQCWLC